MTECAHDWKEHGIRGMFRCASCGRKDFGELCKPGELTVERAKVARLREAAQSLIDAIDNRVFGPDTPGLRPIRYMVPFDKATELVAALEATK